MREPRTRREIAAAQMNPHTTLKAGWPQVQNMSFSDMDGGHCISQMYSDVMAIVPNTEKAALIAALEKKL